MHDINESADVECPEDSKNEAQDIKIAWYDMKPTTKRIHRLLKDISRDPRSSRFCQPIVLEDEPRYLDVITRPLNITTIRDRNSRGCYESSPETAYRDLFLVFDNAIVYHDLDEPENCKLAVEMKEVVTEKLTTFMGSSFTKWLKANKKIDEVLSHSYPRYSKMPITEINALRVKLFMSESTHQHNIRSQAHKLTSTFQPVLPSGGPVLAINGFLTIQSLGEIYPIASYVNDK